MGSYVVYMHTTPKNKRYIGITYNNPERRWQGGMGYKKQPVFYNAIVKYGWSNIRHEIIAGGLTEEAAKAMEIELIASYKTQNRLFGYNCAAGGEGAFGCKRSEESKAKSAAARKGKRLADETKAKISAFNIGKHVTDETRAKLSTINTGKHLSEETRIKLSKGHMGFKYSKETCAKKSKSMKGKLHTSEAKQKMSAAQSLHKKKVYQYTRDGELVKAWDSLSEAMRGLMPERISSGIHNCVAGRTNHAYGFRWTYEFTQSEVEKG